MEVRLRAGETAYQCLVPRCGHVSVSEATESVRMIRCDQCGLPWVKAIKTRRTVVRTTIGANKMADLGLALLMEAAEQK